MELDMARELFMEEKAVDKRASKTGIMITRIKKLIENPGYDKTAYQIIEDSLRLIDPKGGHAAPVRMIQAAVRLELLEKDFAARIVFRAGLMFEETSDYAKAALCYLTSINLHIAPPEQSYWKFNNLGYCLNYLKDFPEAEKQCRKAIELDGERHNAWKNLGIALEHQGKYTEAMDAYERSIKRAGPDERPRMHLDRLIQRQKERLEREIGE